MKKKIKGKPSKKSIENKLDKTWGLVIHSRDNGCQWCKKQDGKMDAHHIFGRISKSTRWLSDNGIKLCFYCHHYRLKKDAEGFREIAIKKLGEKKYLELYQLSKIPAKYIDYDSILLNLLNQLKIFKKDI